MPSDKSSIVVVFAPSPLLEITIDSEPDLQVHLHAGGQGFWIARMIDTLGCDVHLCGAFGGETGSVVSSLIEGSGMGFSAVETGGWNACLVEDRTGTDAREVIRTDPTPLNRHVVDDLFGVTLVEAMDAGVVVLGGPDEAPGLLDPSVYERLARDLTANGCTVLADLSGDAMKRALAGGLGLLKVSSDELVEMGIVKRDTPNEIRRAVTELHQNGSEHVVVSRSDKGVMALLADRTLEFVPPSLDAVNPRGAGDSLTGGIAAGLARGADPVDAVRLGVAAGALNATRHGLASGTRDEIERLSARVEIREL